MSKIGKLKQRLAMIWDLAGEKAPVARNIDIDDAEVQAHPKKYGLKPFRRTKPFKWNPPRDPEHEAWVKEQYDNFDKVVGDIKDYNKDVETEKNLQELLDTETESYESSVTRKPKKHRPKKPTQQDRIDVMEARLKQRIAQVRLAIDYSMESWKSYGPDMDAVKAFMNKRKYFGRKGVVDRKTGTKKGDYKFRTDGRTLFVWDSPVVKHSKDGGFDVSGAKYNTPLTMSTINAVGIHAREGRYDPEGRNRISLGSEFLESNDPTWVHISPDEVQSKPVIYEDRVGGGKKRGTSGVSGVRRPNQAEFSSATIARERVESGIKKGNPPSKTNIQPTDQEDINKITGLNTKIPRETLGVKAHHYLDYADKGKDLPKEHGGIMLPDDYHDFITRFQKGSPKGNQRRLRQVSSKLRLKIARIRMAAAPGISMNPQHGRTIADAFDTMQHTPNSPKVKASYGAFINETNDQARALQKSGVKFEAGKQGGYESHNDMHSDIEKNKHLFYRISDKDYKGFEDNPMFKLTNIKNSAGLRMRANDVFRAVHDINGHNLAGRSTFTPSGEHKAFLQHRKMYTPLASKALFTETAAQANWTNFSKKHGARNQMLQKTKKTGYATDSAGITFPQQKAGLLPDNIIGGNWHQRLGKQRNISRINIAQKSVMNLRETRVSDIRRTWKKQEANIKKYPDGFTILDDDVLDLNQPAHLQKILDKYPGKGNVYIVSSLGGGNKPVTSIDSPEVDKGFDEWKQRNFTPQAGGYEGGVEMNALFRAEDNEQAKVFTKDFDQKAYTEVRPNGTFGFFDRNGNPV